MTFEKYCLDIVKIFYNYLTLTEYNCLHEQYEKYCNKNNIKMI